ncbi:MAG TPA: rhomboid family intramembrane serine protease [Kofleriaceae bacterium]|nr:rhomboid family intramembrane serine protease [Kofleriaceae bacterium]
MAKLRISYNAPVVLTFALLAVVVFLLPLDTRAHWFTTHGNLHETADYVTLVSHILGHQSWDHLLGNFMLILLIGPILEERYGSLQLLVMILATALITGIVNVLLGDTTLGASGIAFMMILLASTANIRQGAIPLTFIAVAVIYLGGEIVRGVSQDDNISQLSHIVGGISGAVFGFLSARARHTDTSIKPSSIKQILPTSTAPTPAKKPVA